MTGLNRQDRAQLRIYTDGACLGNPGPGGWAAILVRGELCEELGGREEHTTNNRMEMMAAVQGLRRVRSGEWVHVVTDSRYLHDGISRWIHAWKRRGWKKADGGEVLNRDLWEDLDRLSRVPARVSWEHVRGHSGHAWNERCDAIATAFARGEKPKLFAGDGSWITGKGRATIPEGMDFPLYLSLVDGELRLHLDWVDCQSWVTGAKGAKYRKVKNLGELEAVLGGWGISEEDAERAGLGGER